MTATTLNPRIAKVLLYQGDDEAQIRELEDRAREAREAGEKSGPRTLGESEEWRNLAAEHDAFVVEAEGRAVTVVLQALGRRQWRDLVLAHPPREDHAADKAAGVNESTFSDVLVPLSLAEPTFGSDTEKERFLDSLNDEQFSRLYLTAFFLNRGGQAAPKASLVSELTPTSDATSN